MQPTIPAGPSIGFTVTSLPIGQIVPVFFTLVFIVWLIYTLVASYHWIRYSNNMTVAFSAIGVHVLVSSVLAIYAVSGLH